jgi:hypothetical protein
MSLVANKQVLGHVQDNTKLSHATIIQDKRPPSSLYSLKFSTPPTSTNS